MTLIEYIKAILEADKGMQRLLSHEIDEVTGHKYLAIHEGVAPEGTRTPYMCIFDDSDDVADAKHLGNVVLSFDVFAENDQRVVRRVTRLVQELFDQRQGMPYFTTAHTLGSRSIPTADNSINAHSTQILFREARYEFVDYKEVKEWDTKDITVYVKVRTNP